MKRAIVLAIFALFVMVVMASADTAVVTVPNGLCLVAASMVPYDSTPSVVFNNNGVAPAGSPIVIHNNLTRYNAVSKGYVAYNKFTPNNYGKVLLGDGAWLNNVSGGSLIWTYACVPNGVPDSNNKKTDMWISLPKTGNTLIGMPFYDQVLWANVLFTDGNSTITVNQAMAAPYNWTDGNAIGYNWTNKGYYTVGPKSYSTNKYIKPNEGYWISTKVDNLALIIPANP